MKGTANSVYLSGQTLRLIYKLKYWHQLMQRNKQLYRKVVINWCLSHLMLKQLQRPPYVPINHVSVFSNYRSVVPRPQQLK